MIKLNMIKILGNSQRKKGLVHTERKEHMNKGGSTISPKENALFL